MENAAQKTARPESFNLHPGFGTCLSRRSEGRAMLHPPSRADARPTSEFHNSDDWTNWNHWIPELFSSERSGKSSLICFPIYVHLRLKLFSSNHHRRFKKGVRRARHLLMLIAVLRRGRSRQTINPGYYG